MLRCCCRCRWWPLGVICGRGGAKWRGHGVGSRHGWHDGLDGGGQTSSLDFDGWSLLLFSDRHG